jgi:phosphoglycolate phosphatase-like HAD superfamily hydrolase
MKKIITLTERDLTRIVRRVIRENNDYKNIETSGNEDWKSKLKSYESKMDDFLRQLKDSGTEIDKKRFLTQIQNQTDQMYWDVYDNSDSEPEGFVELQMNLMKRFRQKLNESDLTRIVKRVINEMDKKEYRVVMMSKDTYDRSPSVESDTISEFSKETDEETFKHKGAALRHAENMYEENPDESMILIIVDNNNEPYGSVPGIVKGPLTRRFTGFHRGY